MKINCKWFCEEKEVYDEKIEAYCWITLKECKKGLPCCGELDK